MNCACCVGLVENGLGKRGGHLTYRAPGAGHGKSEMRGRQERPAQEDTVRRTGYIIARGHGGFYRKYRGDSHGLL